jgi:mannose-6-phosphate isomerase-like protein (cupin superfamily)
MKHLSPLIILFLCSLSLQAQHIQLDTLQAPASYDNIYSQRICGDSLSTTFVIWIKKEVKSHKHQWHSENIIVLEGSAVMKLGSETFTIKSGDHVFIPKNTFHSVVVSQGVLKVISIQSPHFDGRDRVWEHENRD